MNILLPSSSRIDKNWICDNKFAIEWWVSAPDRPEMSCSRWSIEAKSELPRWGFGLTLSLVLQLSQVQLAGSAACALLLFAVRATIRRLPDYLSSGSCALRLGSRAVCIYWEKRPRSYG
jgi:hypothetical protein